MNNNTYVAVLLGTVLAIPVWADTLISAGETLTVTNTEDLGFSSIQMGTGATLAFVGASAASAGMNEYTRTGTSSMGTPGLSSYGTWTRITSDAYWASANITEATTEYIYTGRWHIPAAGLYSVFEHIDDAALIAIDGRAVLQNTSYNTTRPPACATSR